MADTISLGFVHGDDVTFPVELTATGSPTTVDLTGATVKADIRKEYTGDVIASFTPNYTDLPNGKFELGLTSAQTSLLPQNTRGRINSFVFDVEITYLDTTKDTIISGYLKVTNEVTV